MNPVPDRVQAAVLARSLTIQGSWNYETLIGTGFAFTVLPALRATYEGDPRGLEAAIARHAGVFNSHPYLATIAAGAVARLEHDRVPPEVTERFKSALRGSLGSLGDRLVWTTWRPATLLLGLMLLIVGCPWWVAVSVFLLTYTALHIPLRLWGMRVGTRYGLQVARVVREAPLEVVGSRAADAGALLVGLALIFVIDPLDLDPVRIAATAAGGGLGLWLGLRARAVAGVAVGATWVVALFLGLFI